MGKVKLIANPGAGLISDQGGALISDQGGALISDQGGAVISNNGGTLLSNNAAGLAGTARRVVLQAGAGLGVYGLANAEVRLFDAAGRLLVDEAGKPLTATTGPDAAFKLDAVLPPGNLVARVRLWNGGELSAIVARDGAQQAALELTTASSLGASYVLGLVNGSQEVLDKLPRAESDRLNRELDVVRGFAKGAFKHEAATLDAITAKLRQRVPAVDRVAEDIKALLLGQARLGSGRLATEVPLGSPATLLSTARGLLLTEMRPGRVRRLAGDGTLETLVDKGFGTFKSNHPGLQDLVEAPDGTLYLTQRNAFRVYRLRPGQAPEAWLGTGEPGRDPAGPRTAMRVAPRSLALGPDGTLWVGEERGGGDIKRTPPRLVAVRPDGRTEVYQDPAWGPGDVTSLAVGADDAVWALHVAVVAVGGGLQQVGRISRLRAGAFEPVAEGLSAGDWADMALGPDGTLYVSSDGPAGVGTLSAQGAWTPLPQQEALRALGLVRASGLSVGPDGTLHVSDMATNLVAAVPPGGAPRLVAGTRALFQRGEGGGFAINMPGGLAVDSQQRLYVSELGSHTVRAYDGASLATVAGTVAGYGGDGGPAMQARLQGPKGVAWGAAGLWVVDDQNGVLRRVRTDGTIETAAGRDRGSVPIPPGESIGADVSNFEGGTGLVLGPRGEPVWANAKVRQVQWLDTRGAAPVVRHLLGAVQDFSAGAMDSAFGSLLVGPSTLEPGAVRLVVPFGVAFGPDGALYVSDSGTMQVYRVRGFDTTAPTLEVFAGLHFSETLARLAQDPTLPDEEGRPAREAMLGLPTGIAFDAAGNLYVCEAGTRNLDAVLPMFGNSFPIDTAMLPVLPTRIRRITPGGVITTVAGPGGKRFAEPDAEDALVAPTGLAWFPDGRLALADSGSNLVHILPAGSF
jgi:sugar lactone lactonase YvrE